MDPPGSRILPSRRSASSLAFRMAAAGPPCGTERDGTFLAIAGDCCGIRGLMRAGAINSAPRPGAAGVELHCGTIR